MSQWQVVYTKQAEKDFVKLSRSRLKERAFRLVELLRSDPFATPPAFEALVGELSGSYSRRINAQHRLVYEVFVEIRVVKVVRMWTHYE